ncbi:MAG: TIGR03032 family protein [Pseudomonadota bacterium]
MLPPGDVSAWQRRHGGVGGSTVSAVEANEQERKDGANNGPQIEFSATRLFRQWMGETQSAFAFTTYQGGALCVIGVKQDGFLDRSFFPFERCMGLAHNETALWVASRYQMWRFSNNVTRSEQEAGIGRAYRPRVAYVTGDIDIHEIDIDAGGRPIFANTAFSCLATVSDTSSFQEVWRPKFVSRLASEDRCHLNGLAMRDGKPGFVTAFSMSDTSEGWRQLRVGGGVVIDVDSHEPVATGLSLPHSPRWHKGRLYVLNSGEGSFGEIDLNTGSYQEIARLPGYARGLDFVGRFAVVGLSMARDGVFSGLPLEDRLTQTGEAARCGIRVIDLDTGDVVHGLDIQGKVQELFDVRLFPNIPRIALMGGRAGDYSKLVSAEQKAQ